MQNKTKENTMILNNTFWIYSLFIQACIYMPFGAFIKIMFNYYNLGLSIFLAGVACFSLSMLIQGLKIEFDKKHKK